MDVLWYADKHREKITAETGYLGERVAYLWATAHGIEKLVRGVTLQTAHVDQALVGASNGKNGNNGRRTCVADWIGLQGKTIKIVEAKYGGNSPDGAQAAVLRRLRDPGVQLATRGQPPELDTLGLPRGERLRMHGIVITTLATRGGEAEVLRGRYERRYNPEQFRDSGLKFYHVSQWYYLQDPEVYARCLRVGELIGKSSFRWNAASNVYAVPEPPFFDKWMSLNSHPDGSLVPGPKVIDLDIPFSPNIKGRASSLSPDL